MDDCMHERTARGHWMLTATGRQFWPLDPKADDVSVEDLATALSNYCRYGGHVSRFYSVAEHCSNLADWFIRQGREDLAREAILHDAAEAYVGDIIRPLKADLPAFEAIEQRVHDAIMQRFGLKGGKLHPDVKLADDRILTDEVRALKHPEEAARHGWRLLEPLGVRIWGVPPVDARAAYLSRLVYLFGLKLA